MNESSLYFVVNPHANAGHVIKRWKALCDSNVLPVNAEVVETDSLPSLAAIADTWAHDARLVAIGGDGSLHQLINYTQNRQLSYAIVPMGTGSDVCRSLALPRDPKQALMRVLSGEQQVFDAMACELDGRLVWGVNVLSAGYSALVAGRVNALAQKRAWSYLQQGLSALVKREAVSCQVHCDDVLVFEGSALLVGIANGQYFGKGMKIAPPADATDGWLDVVIVRDAPLPILVPHIPLLFPGWHMVSSLVTHVRAKSISVITKEGALPLEIDGETYQANQLVARVVEGGIWL